MPLNVAGSTPKALRDLSGFSLGEQSVLAVRTVQVVREDASRRLLQPLPRGVCKHPKPRFVYGYAYDVARPLQTLICKKAAKV